MTDFTDSELEAYLDEALDAETAATIERMARDDETLADRLRRVAARREAGVHSLGEIWRQARVTCPDREQWGSFLMGVLHGAEADYMTFHLEIIGCRYCKANVEDLQQKLDASANAASQSRSRRYFETSAGLMRKGK